MPSREQQTTLPRLQDQLFRNPQVGIEKDLYRIYEKGEIQLGWPEGATRIFAHLARQNTAAIIGVALGDEGKGRIVDNKIQCLLDIPEVKQVYVVRFNGGNNSGHSLEKADGTRLAVNVVPSSVMRPKAIGVIDRGMVVNTQDLQTEVEYVESKVGDTRGKLFLSEEAVLNTDLDRAQEIVNRIKNGGAKGGTGRGIGPSTGDFLARQNYIIHDLLKDDWRDKLEKLYTNKQKEFAGLGIDLADIDVPDYRAEKLEGKKGEAKRKVGSKGEFLDRLEEARDWLIARNIVTNTFILHQETYEDLSKGVIFEGAQAVGLHPWLGTRPDVTSSDTSADGIKTGTGYWLTQDINDRLGIFKITYMSSVGAREMLTEIPLDNLNLNDLTPDQKRGLYIRTAANEKGTTTGRYRDICHLDLAHMTYNIRMSRVEVLAGTHLDIAREGEAIKVCTHYTDKFGKYVPYQPGLRHQENLIPHYVELPGWDGEACRSAKSLKDLPDNAVKFLAFVQARTGFPIVAATTGPARENFMIFNGYNGS